MTYSLEMQMELIRTGRMVQFSQPVQIQQITLAIGQETEIHLPGLCSTLWMPPTVIMPDYSVFTNPAAAQIGIRINLRSAPILHWGIKGNFISAFTGPVEKIFVTPILNVTSDIILLAARGIGIAYSGGLTAAGTPSGAPAFGTSPGKL